MAARLLLAAVAIGLFTAALAQKASDTTNPGRADSRDEKIRPDPTEAEYFFNVKLAYSAWQQKDIEQAEQLLGECSAEHRHWEWYFVDHLCDGKSPPQLDGSQSDRRSLTSGEQQPFIHAVAFSPDGTQIATAGDSSSLKSWDAATGCELLAYVGHEQYVTGVAFSPDGRRIASTSGDGTVRIWDSDSGRQLLTFKAHSDNVYCVDFSPNGKHVVSGGSGDNRLRVWEVATGKEALLLTGHEHWVLHAAFSPNGKHIASASYDNTIRLWDAASGREVLKIPAGTSGIAFGPDGKSIAGGIDKTVRLWDSATGEEIKTLEAAAAIVMDVAFSPDGKRIAAACKSFVGLWDTGSGRLILTLSNPPNCNVVAFSPDGIRIVAANFDFTPPKVWTAAGVWDGAARK